MNQFLSNLKFVKLVFVWILGFVIWNLLSPSPILAANSGIFTVSIWVKPTSSIASQALIGKAEEFRVFTDASGNLGCQIKSTTWQTASTGTTALTLNAWNHVACAYDKATLKVYVNGVQANSNSLTATIDDTANAILLGQDSSASTPYSNLTGTTDDFKFYNYARTQKQVIEDMGGGHPAVLAGSSGPSSVIASAARQSGPVGYWKFDEGYSTTANNSGSGGSALNGTLTGMASPATSTSGWTQAGKFNRGLNFDGSDDKVSIPSAITKDLTGTVSVSFWLSVVAAPSGYGFVLAQRDGGNGPDTFSVELHPNAGGRTDRLYLWWSTSLGTFTGYASDDNHRYRVGVWDHWTIVRDASTSTVKMYRNGQDAGATLIQNSFGTAQASTGVFTLGNNSYDGTNGLNGIIDEVKIYPYALTAQEILADYNHGSAQILGALSDNTSSSFTSTSSVQAADHEYCIPGDTTTCTAPVGRWDFDEGTGSTVNDKSGNNNVGTWNGTLGNQWKTGKIGKAGNFNGSNNYVSITDNTALDFGTGPISISMWMKTSNTSQEGFLVDTSNNLAGNGFFIDFRGDLGTDYIDARLCTSNGNCDSVASTTKTVNDNTWHHIVFTRNGTNVYLYIDGIQQGSTTDNLRNMTNTNNLVFGASSAGSTIFYTGFIDQVRIFNYARSAAQIAWDYNRGAPVAHWKMDECQGTTIHNSSENSNHGTITIGASGTQTSVGTCTGSANTAWKDGATGKFNSSLDFDGTDDYVDLGTSSIFAPSTMTLSAWVKLSTTANTIPTVLKKTPVGYATGYSLEGLTPTFHLRTSSGWLNSGAAPALTVGQWTHLTATYDGTTAKIYTNGVLSNSAAVSGYLTPTGSLYMGVDPGDTSDSRRWFPGQLDDARVYNYALTATQVKLLYNQGGAIRYGPATGTP